MPGFESPSFLLAFGAGVLSFLSPCCLPVYPAYLSYLSGVTVGTGGGRNAMRSRVMSHSVAFVIGFSVIWVALGYASSLLGSFFTAYRDILAQIGGVLVIVFGLSLLGVLRLPLLAREYRLQFAERPTGYAGSVAIGMAFAAGWTPCIGPILSGVLIMAANRPGQGAPLLLAYSLGFAIPFLLLAYTMGSTRWLLRYSGIVEKVGGALMIVMGVLLVTKQLSVILAWFTNWVGFQGF